MVNWHQEMILYYYCIYIYIYIYYIYIVLLKTQFCCNNWKNKFGHIYKLLFTLIPRRKKQQDALNCPSAEWRKNKLCFCIFLCPLSLITIWQGHYRASWVTLWHHSCWPTSSISISRQNNSLQVISLIRPSPCALRSPFCLQSLLLPPSISLSVSPFPPLSLSLSLLGQRSSTTGGRWFDRGGRSTVPLASPPRS